MGEFGAWFFVGTAVGVIAFYVALMFAAAARPRGVPGHGKVPTVGPPPSGAEHSRASVRYRLGGLDNFAVRCACGWEAISATSSGAIDLHRQHADREWYGRPGEPDGR